MDSVRVSSSEKTPEARPFGRAQSANKPSETPQPGAFFAMLSGMEESTEEMTDAGRHAATGLMGTPIGQGPMGYQSETTQDQLARDAFVLAAAFGSAMNPGHAMPGGGRAGALSDTGMDGVTSTMAGKHAGKGSGSSSLLSATPSNLAGLLVNSLWAGHALSAEGLVAQTSRIDTAHDTLPASNGWQSGASPAADKKRVSVPLSVPMSALQLSRASHVGNVASDEGVAAAKTGAFVANTAAESLGLISGGKGGVPLSTSNGDAASVRSPHGQTSAPLLSDIQGFVASAAGLGTEMRGNDSGQKQGTGGAAYSEVKAAVLPGIEPGLEFSAVASDPSLISAEDAVAEQVTYWLTDQLKNAQLTVDHEGQAVNVRVSLAGNEAHVAFRSDKAETRALLDANITDLRDLLLREGLVLTGMTVDSQGAGGSAANREAPPREGRRVTRVTSAEESGARPAAQQLLSAHPDRVDLFV